MKNKIFLGGGGGAEDSFLLDREFISSLRNKKIAYIPLALEPKNNGYEGCYDWISGALSQHGEVYIEMWTDLSSKNIKDIQRFDAVYMGGGNTYKLLDLIYKTKFDSLLKRFHENNGIVYGGSAGAIVLGKDIQIVSEENDNNYTNNNGLNMIENFSIICHYKDTDVSKIRLYLERYKNKLIAIPEKSGIIIDNGKMKAIGTEPIKIFNTNHKETILNPGQTIIIKDQDF